MAYVVTALVACTAGLVAGSILEVVYHPVEHVLNKLFGIHVQ